ncbi:mannose-6-phosphate isomerase, class I [Corynebacterium terpenotabidum]|uniref:mannose-6-phosphate isomerase n=1 Tax=Corynebacterium terpenotabidum Y-11 TaxID=1200352 RepID=S4XLB7_9CORY|nr:mannose-6-phosphate isomerase, class I [Corynebacterium terpenotabidum]AGP31393.1 mannose-6-phosphate isomerase [Corynebacterium terpenotabidum Y-11]
MADSPLPATDPVLRIDGTVRNYAWGSRTALAELTGRPLPTEHPEAEMWFGAHPAAPSRITGTDRSLLDVISGDPAGQLGPDRAGDRLPFLLKLLAADQALSLQAHPTKRQAEEGYARENAAGIPLTAAHRNYRDDNHKPELLVALTRFEALTGFRPLSRSRELLTALAVPGLERTTALLGSGSDADDLRALVTTWISLPSASKIDLVSATADRCRELAADPRTADWMRGSAGVAVDLAEQYPGDSGVLISLLLNHVVLQPGEAVYLDAGNLHAYLRGTGVEIMANSDNVLRGGLTTKHVDVPELMRVMDFSPVVDPVCRRDAAGRFDVPVPDFALQEVDRDQTTPVTGPAVVLVATGGAELSGMTQETAPVQLRPGQAVWVPADVGSTVGVTSLGRTFIATVG